MTPANPRIGAHLAMPKGSLRAVFDNLRAARFRLIGPVPRGLASLSTHGLGLAETPGLARALGKPIPRLLLLGVEAGRVSWNVPRSAAVEEAIDGVVKGFPRLRSFLMRFNGRGPV